MKPARANQEVDEDQLRIINEFLSQDFRVNQITKYDDVPDLDLLPFTSEFLDDCKLHEQALVLSVLEDNEIAKLGRETIPMIVSGFSQQGVAQLLLLAYNLKDPKDRKPIFPAICAYNDADVPYSAFPSLDIIPTNRVHHLLPATGNPHEEAVAYSYLAASLLRLYSKSEGNYMKAFNYIINGFSRFYRFSMPVRVPQPTIEALKTLSQCVFHRPIMKATLYRILYEGGGTSTAKELRKSLYEVHLSFTGLQSGKIFIQLCSATNCPPSTLLEALHSREYSKQLDALVALIDLNAMEDDNHTRQMWRYGRLFDEGFLTPLGAKTCPSSAFLLANALKNVDPESNQGILNIVHFENINPDRKRILTASGVALAKMLRNTDADEPTSRVAKKDLGRMFRDTHTDEPPAPSRLAKKARVNIW